MMKEIALILIVSSFAFCFSGCNKDAIEESVQIKISEPNEFDDWIGVCNSQSNRIEVYSIESSDWNTTYAKKISWIPFANNGYNEAEVKAWGAPKDVRLRKSPWGDVWVTIGGTLATIVHQNSGDKKWALGLDAKPYGVELLPNGNIVIAAKDDNWVRIYNSSQGLGNYSYDEIRIEAPSSVLWDATESVIRVASKTKLVAIKVLGTDSNPVIEEDSLSTNTLPNSEGLDVSAYYGEANKLWVSTRSGVYIYNKTTKKYIAVNGEAFRSNVNSIGNLSLSTIVQAQTIENASSTIDLFKNNGEFETSQLINGSLVNRIRIWKTDYEYSEFSIAVIPDTQVYTSEFSGGTIGMFTAQTKWIKTNQEFENIAYVAHVGDISEFGDAREEDWINADIAMSILENADPVIPYGVAVGNHEQLVTENPYEGLGDPFSPSVKFNQYFGKSRFEGRSYYGGAYVGLSCPEGNNDSHYDFFSALGMDFIVIYLEYDSQNEDPGLNDWAYILLDNYPNRKAIIVSHYILNTDGTFTAQGNAIYNRLKEKSNFFLMLCGHVTDENYRQDVYNNNRVTTILADYQGRKNGGNGYMQILKFSLTANTIKVKTYSPYLNKYDTDGDSQYQLLWF